MAQLIKLQDYVSRYENDLYRYPSQFVRLKKQQWEKLKQQWENPEDEVTTVFEEQHEKLDRPSFKSRIFSLIKRQQAEQEEEEFHSWSTSREQNDEEMHFELNNKVETIEDLKKLFLDLIFDFQLRWASSTVSQKSYVDHSFYHDEKLKYLLQRFPDNILLFYYPILKIKNAPVELDVVFITPTALWCIHFIEEEDEMVFIGSNERFWTKKKGNTEKKVLNPLISLNRMEKLLMQIFKTHEVDFPIKKLVLSRNGYIDFPQVPYGIQLLDKRTHEEWFQQQRSISSPIKSMQLKSAQALIHYCETTSFRRMHREEPLKVNEDLEEGFEND